MQPTLGRWERKQQFPSLPDTDIQCAVIPSGSKTHILPIANSHCVFFKHPYHLFWECLYFSSVGLLWSLGPWLWQRDPRDWEILFRGLWALHSCWSRTHIDYTLACGLSFYRIHSGQLKYSALRKNSFLDCIFFFFKATAVVSYNEYMEFFKCLSTIW